MILSLNPTYFCNFRNGKCADTCYLTKSQLSDSRLLKIETIKARIQELSESFKLEHIDLYGGEITILPLDYQLELISYLAGLNVSVNLVTNLSNTDSPFIAHLPRNFTLSVSWDFEARQASDKVFDRMEKLPHKFSILSLATPEFARFDPEMILGLLMKLPNLQAYEIKPYNQNQSNHHSFTHKDYEDLIQKYIILYKKLKPNFQFVNIDLLQMSLAKVKSSWSDQHLYLTPDDTWSVLEFDQKGNEYFKKLNSIPEYLAWSKQEKEVFEMDPHCRKCRHLGHCLSEHLKPIDRFETNGCSGFKNLLDWFETTGRTL